MSSKQKKAETGLSEIISPIFGHDYQNRVVTKSKQSKSDSTDSSNINCVEKQIEVAYETKTLRNKAQEYQEPFKFDTDVLKNYHKQKEAQELKAALPSNYLNFHDTLKKTVDLSSVSDFTSVSDELTTIKEETETINNFSEVSDDFFNQE